MGLQVSCRTLLFFHLFLPPVLGPMAPNELGVTFSHEHLILDMSAIIMKPQYGPDNLKDLEVKMENLGRIRHFP